MEITFEEYLEATKHITPDKNCRIMKSLEIFNGKWRTKVCFELSKKEFFRFGELKKAIPEITNTMLTSTLKDLENLGVVYRQQFNEIPPHVEYSLTESGRALMPIFFEIAKWAERHM